MFGRAHLCDYVCVFIVLVNFSSIYNDCFIYMELYLCVWICAFDCVPEFQTG